MNARPEWIAVSTGRDESGLVARNESSRSRVVFTEKTRRAVKVYARLGGGR